jgi:RNA polymerase sigma-70 factor (family 1)
LQSGLFLSLFSFIFVVNEYYRKLTREEFKQLFDRYFEDIRRYVLYRCGDGELATDIAQDVFMRVWEKQMKIEPETARYLFIKIANDLYITRYRREKRAFNFFSTWKPTERNHTPEDEMNYNELKRVYEEALKTMPEKQRTVFLMNRIDNLKYREIAGQLGLSEKAVEKRMSLALHHLKSFLKETGGYIILFFLGCNIKRFISLNS